MNRKQLANMEAFLAELEQEQARLVRCLIQRKWITTKAPRDLTELDLHGHDRTILEAIRAARLEVDAAESVDPDVIEILKALAGMPNKFTERDPATGKMRSKFECVECEPKPSLRQRIKLAACMLGFALCFADLYFIQQRVNAMRALRAAVQTETGLPRTATDPSAG